MRSHQDAHASKEGIRFVQREDRPRVGICAEVRSEGGGKMEGGRKRAQEQLVGDVHGSIAAMI